VTTRTPPADPPEWFYDHPAALYALYNTADRIRHNAGLHRGATRDALLRTAAHIADLTARREFVDDYDPALVGDLTAAAYVARYHALQDEAPHPV
jgi:hypothetical protein